MRWLIMNDDFDWPNITNDGLSYVTGFQNVKEFVPIPNLYLLINSKQLSNYEIDSDLKTTSAKCNYCGKDYACHTVLNGISNMWSHLKVCKTFLFVVDKKQKVLVLKCKKEKDELLFSMTLQPRFDIPSHFTVMRGCLKLYVKYNS
uniref:BED-type domain-containing protein n=1 Tax=Salix viminalis TaxID=40686 RepID=A0A6N2LGW6_SALVM